jgi:hypothetical protein
VKLSPLEPETAKLYLLGQLDQTSLTQIEQELLTSATLYDEILLAEDELTDQYLANELSEEERRSFETHFLSSPERLQKLRFARAFRRYVGEAGESLQDATSGSVKPAPTPFKPIAKKSGLLSFLPVQNPIAAYALAAAVVIGFIGISWIAFNSLKPPPRGSGKLLIVSLTPGLTRENGEIKSFAVAADTDSVQLNLELPANEFPGYQAELLTGERESLLVKADLRPESIDGKGFINFTIPAALLKRNDYRVRLSGRTATGTYEPLSSYTFRVTDNR